MVLLEVKNVKKVYTARFGGNKVQALENVNFSVEGGEYVAIMGESGSGKTTLLNNFGVTGQADSRASPAVRKKLYGSFAQRIMCIQEG